MIYIYNIVSIMVVACITKSYRKNGKVFLFVFCLIQMTLITGLRYYVGADFESYWEIYNEIDTKVNYVGDIELGYWLINKICSILHISYVGLNIIIAFLTYYFVLKALLELSKYFFLSIYLYISFFFFYSSMNHTRQAIAIAFAMYAIVKLCKGGGKEFWKYIIIGMLFHFSIGVLIPLYFLKNIKINKKVITLYIIIFTVTLVTYHSFVSLLSFTKYAIYFQSEYDIRGLDSTVVNFVVRFLMLIISMWFLKKSKGTECNIFYHMILLCTATQVLTMYSAVWGRITTNFFVGYLFLIPKLIKEIRNKQMRVLAYIGCLLIVALYHYVYFVIKGDAVGITTYRSIFQK